MWARAGETLASFSLALLLVTLGCGQHTLEQDGGSDPSSDTDSPPAECPSYGIELSEAYSAYVVAAVMFPASQGGANYVTARTLHGGLHVRRL